MNPVKEFLWLIRIYNSEAIFDLAMIGKLKAIPLKKSDFERIAGAPPRDTVFSDWFDNLVKEGVLSFAGKIKAHERETLVNSYTGTAKNLVKYMEKNPSLDELYKEYGSFFARDRFL